METQIQRDVRDVTRIHSFDALPRLLARAAAHTSQLINVSDPSAPFQISRQTIHEYVTVEFGRLHQIPGLACALQGIDAAALDRDRPRLGSLLETFALQELRRQASWRAEPIDFFHYRDRDDFEVDIVLEQGSFAIAGVEVKAAATVTEADFRGLRKLRDVAGSRFTAGVVLYDGSASINFGEKLFAVPIRQMWEH